MTGQLSLFEQQNVSVSERRAFVCRPGEHLLNEHGVYPRHKAWAGQPEWSWKMGILLSVRAELRVGLAHLAPRQQEAIERRRAALNEYADRLAKRAPKAKPPPIARRSRASDADGHQATAEHPGGAGSIDEEAAADARPPEVE